MRVLVTHARTHVCEYIMSIAILARALVRSTVSQVTPFPFFNVPVLKAMKAMKAMKAACSDISIFWSEMKKSQSSYGDIKENILIPEKTRFSIL